MEKHIPAATDGTDLADRLDSADLIVGVHNCYEACVIADCCLHFLRPDNSVLMDVKKSDIKSFLLQLFESVQYCMVLDCRGNDVHLSLFPSQLGRRNYGLVICFTSAGCECYLTGIRTDHGCDLRSRLFKDFLRMLPDSVQTGRVSIAFFHNIDHCIDCRFTHFGSRGVVGINHWFSPFVTFIQFIGFPLVETQYSPIHLLCQ